MKLVPTDQCENVKSMYRNSCSPVGPTEPGSAATPPRTRPPVISTVTDDIS